MAPNGHLDSEPLQRQPFQTRKALLIINCQNDSFYKHGSFQITSNPEFVEPLREVVPYFRKMGDVIWVRTEVGIATGELTADSYARKRYAPDNAKNAHLVLTPPLSMTAPNSLEEEQQHRAQLPLLDNTGQTPTYHPSNMAKKLLTQASTSTKTGKRTTNLHAFDDGKNSFEDQMLRPKDGQKTLFYIAGTKGAEICDSLIDLVDGEHDTVFAKHFYSAFEDTSLLTTLRSRLVTEVYLCGGLTNISIYSTAADAVQHGMGVRVLGDCIGYRSEEKHDLALREMVDIMGVEHLLSNELIEESGGRPVPDATIPGMRIEDLALHHRINRRRNLKNQCGEPSPEDLDQHLSNDLQGSSSSNDSGGNTKASLAVGVDGERIEGQETLPSHVEPSAFSTTSKILAAGTQMGSGDSTILLDFLGAETAAKVFEHLRTEVTWLKMGHRGGEVPRLVAVQGEIARNGAIPVYRHPADESPALSSYTPTVMLIKRKAEELLKQPFNHVLIQLYRSGQDNISEHADKTLDIVRGSNIVNVSLGARRNMTLRRKKGGFQGRASGDITSKPRDAQRIPMPHDSVFVLGPQTNKEWLHGVRADRRREQEKNDAELAFAGERISLTFRQIGTFMNPFTQQIWGQGAIQKIHRSSGCNIQHDSAQTEAMVTAFGKENHDMDFDWDTNYGCGFNIINLETTKPELATLVLCNDNIANLRVRLLLEEKGIPYVTNARPTAKQAHESMVEKPWIHGLSNTETPILSGIGADNTVIKGDLAILIYLEKHFPTYPSKESSATSAKSEGSEHTVSGELRASYTTAQLYSCAAQSNELLYLWHEYRSRLPHSRPTARFTHENRSAASTASTNGRPSTPEASLGEELHEMLRGWEDYLAGSEMEFLAGDVWSVIDCAFWPVLGAVVDDLEAQDEVHSHEVGKAQQAQEQYPSLWAYHISAKQRLSVRKVLGS